MYKNLGREVAFTTAVATFVCLYNGLVGGFTDLAGVDHEALIQATFLPKIGLPLSPFTLASPSLGLLLGTFLFALVGDAFEASNCFCPEIQNVSA